MHEEYSICQAYKATTYVRGDLENVHTQQPRRPISGGRWDDNLTTWLLENTNDPAPSEDAGSEPAHSDSGVGASMGGEGQLPAVHEGASVSVPEYSEPQEPSPDIRERPKVASVPYSGEGTSYKERLLRRLSDTRQNQ